MKFIDIHTHNSQKAENILSVKNCLPKDIINNHTYFSIGIHPWFLNSNTCDAEILQIAQKISNPNCIALGECGLDLSIKVEFLLQKKMFIKQILLAENNNKPIIIHCVKAHQELLDIVKTQNISVPILFHGFSKNSHIHNLLMKFPNIYFSYGQSMINSKTTQGNIAATPLDKLFIETDDASIDIKLLYAKTAEIKKISVENLQKQVLLNFQKVFKIDIIDDNG